MQPIDVSGFETAILRVRGDGKAYQLWIMSDPAERHSYTHAFQTGGEWEEIEIPLRAMWPIWRGDRLDLPPYPGETLSHVRFMIGNGRAESFRLEIDSIRLR